MAESDEISCPYCLEPNHPRASQLGGSIVCTACGSEFNVPGRPPAEPVSAEAAAESVGARSSSDYSLSDADLVPPRQYLLAICPTCRTRIHAESTAAECDVECPDCGTKTVARRVVAKQVPNPSLPASTDGYGIADGALEHLSPQHYFAMTCPTCGTRLTPRRDEVGSSIQCHDCRTQHIVPEPPPPTEKFTYAAVEEYGISDISATPQQRREHYFAIRCPRCQTRMTPHRNDAGKTISCPDCYHSFQVPEPPPPGKPRTLPKPREVPIRQREASPPPRRPSVQPRAIAERIPLAKPPRWTFASGVFDFCFRGDALMPLGYASIGVVATGIVLTLAIQLSGLFSGNMSGLGAIGGGGFFLAGFLFFVWTFSYLATCMLAIMQETSHGADQVQGWPEADWRQWLFALLHVGYIAVLAAVVGYGVELLLAATTGIEQAGWLATIFLAFPILLLGSLYADTPFMPLSGIVSGSLFRLWWAWMVVYLESLLLVGGWLATAIGLSLVSPYLAVIVAGPILVPVLFTYARLLGRLAWRMNR